MPLKLEALAPRWGRTDLLPMWVADMDFKTPPFIVEVMKKRMEMRSGLAIQPDLRVGMRLLSVGKHAATNGQLPKR